MRSLLGDIRKHIRISLIVTGSLLPVVTWIYFILYITWKMAMNIERWSDITIVLPTLLIPPALIFSP